MRFPQLLPVLSSENGKNFRSSEITPDKFKCLVFVQGLTAPYDAEIRLRLQTKVEQNQKIKQRPCG